MPHATLDHDNHGVLMEGRHDLPNTGVGMAEELGQQCGNLGNELLCHYPAALKEEEELRLILKNLVTVTDSPSTPLNQGMSKVLFKTLE